MEVNSKREREALDRNNFEQANFLVGQIIENIKETMGDDYDMGMALIEDYLFDLINPSLLDFESRDS